MSEEIESEVVVYDDIDDDYTFSRSAYYKIIKVGLDNLEKIADLAHDSEHPRAFEVLSTYMKNLADTNDKLIELQRRKQVVDTSRTAKQRETQAQISGQTAFTGSTDALLRMLEDKRNQPTDAEFEEIEDDQV